MKVRFNVKCRAAGVSYAEGQIAEISEASARQLMNLHRGSVDFVSPVEPDPKPEPKAKAKAKAKAKVKPRAKRKKEKATSGD